MIQLPILFRLNFDMQKSSVPWLSQHHRVRLSFRVAKSIDFHSIELFPSAESLNGSFTVLVFRKLRPPRALHDVQGVGAILPCEPSPACPQLRSRCEHCEPWAVLRHQLSRAFASFFGGVKQLIGRSTPVDARTLVNAAVVQPDETHGKYLSDCRVAK